MKLDASDIRELEPVIRAVVLAVLDEVQTTDAKFAGRLAFTEPEAAAQFGIARHCLRDARLRGEIRGKLVGKRILYSRDQLLRFLGDTR